MIPEGTFTARVQEAYENGDGVPTVALQGAREDTGPLAVLLQGKGLDLAGITIGTEVEVSFKLPPVPALAAGLRYVLPDDEAVSPEGEGADLPRAR